MSINDKILLTVSQIFSTQKSSLFQEIGKNPVAEGPFPENNILYKHIEKLEQDSYSAVNNFIGLIAWYLIL